MFCVYQCCIECLIVYYFSRNSRYLSFSASCSWIQLFGRMRFFTCLIWPLNFVFIYTDDSPTDDRCRRRSRLLSEGEVVLLESVAHHSKRLPNGRFLTMHKRRRKKLTTRSLSNENAPALLDDIQHGQVQVRMNSYTLHNLASFDLTI